MFTKLDVGVTTCWKIKSAFSWSLQKAQRVKKFPINLVRLFLSHFFPFTQLSTITPGYSTQWTTVTESKSWKYVTLCIDCFTLNKLTLMISWCICFWKSLQDCNEGLFSHKYSLKENLYIFLLISYNSGWYFLYTCSQGWRGCIRAASQSVPPLRPPADRDWPPCGLWAGQLCKRSALWWSRRWRSPQRRQRSYSGRQYCRNGERYHQICFDRKPFLFPAVQRIPVILPCDAHADVVRQGYDGADRCGKLDIWTGKLVFFVNISDYQGNNN